MDDLIYRQDAINEIELLLDKTAKGDIGIFYNKILKLAIEHIQNMPSEQQWIPCSERLPSGQENVIVTIYDDHGDTPWEYTTNAWHIDGVWIADNDIVCGSVLAWMPLPQPWEEVKDG